MGVAFLKCFQVSFALFRRSEIRGQTSNNCYYYRNYVRKILFQLLFPPNLGNLIFDLLPEDFNQAFVLLDH